MKYRFFSDKSIIAILLLLGVATHLAWLGTPDSAVFDEVHFGKFLSAYFTGEYYFDIHPPLGKLILAAWGRAWGFRPGFSFANIGDIYPDRLYVALRLLPSLAGTLLPLAVYGVARRLKMSAAAAFAAGALVALDNALLVQSRLILLDSFLLLFGFGAVYSYLRWRDGGTGWLLPIAGILGGAAVCIKWTGATFLALIALMELVRLWRERRAGALRRIGPVVASLVVLPLITYVTPFVVHFMLLTRTGTGDAFMSREFQRDLVGSPFYGDPSVRSLTIGEKVLELNEEMYRSNARLTATHPYSSAWYTWPLMERPIFYWVRDTARIYLVGNPVVWWGSAAAVLVTVLSAAWSAVRRSPGWFAEHRVPLILMGAWLMNLLPFMGIDRVMFLYHYFTALMWAILMLAWWVDRARKPRRFALQLTLVTLVVFVFFAPLSYGLPLSESAYNWRVWLASWK